MARGTGALDNGFSVTGWEVGRSCLGCRLRIGLDTQGDHQEESSAQPRQKAYPTVRLLVRFLSIRLEGTYCSVHSKLASDETHGKDYGDA